MQEEVRSKLALRRKCAFVKRLRQRMTPEEKILWKVLRGRRCRGFKFRRQVHVGPYVADFLCKEHRLIVEVDGGVHQRKDQKEHDCMRDVLLREYGYRVLRIANNGVRRNLPRALDIIATALHLEGITKKHTIPLSSAEERG